MVFQTRVSVVVTLAVGGALLDGSIVEFNLRHKGKGTAGNSVLVASRVNELGVWVDAGGLRRVVPREQGWSRRGQGHKA